MADHNDESMIRYLLTEVVESAVNIALAYEPLAQERLRDHLGRVLRVKTNNPDWIFFVAVCDDGIQLFSRYEEMVDARITLPASLITQAILGNERKSVLEMEEVRCGGDVEFIEDILAIAQQFSLWALVKRVINNWVPEMEGLKGMVEVLKKNDPAWIVRLEHLPQLANETLMAVRSQGELLLKQEKELAAIKQQLIVDRRTNRISTIIGFCLIVAAFLAHNGYFQVPQLQNISLDTLILLILSMVILIPRLISGR